LTKSRQAASLSNVSLKLVLPFAYVAINRQWDTRLLQRQWQRLTSSGTLYCVNYSLSTDVSTAILSLTWQLWRKYYGPPKRR
jgi:hypothetical protein